jgi:hypothetical protein
VRRLYALSVFIPVAIALELADASPTAIFFTSALGLIPTAVLMSDAMRLGRSARTGEPYSRYLADPQVEEVGGHVPVVRMVARTAPGGPPAFLLQALDAGDLPGLAG